MSKWVIFSNGYYPDSGSIIMRKKLCIICFIFLVLIASAYAADTVTFYKQMPGMFLVDLSSEYYPSHSSSVQWQTDYKGTDGTYYSDNVLIAVLGIKNATDDVKITAILSGGDWTYRLDSSDSSISRPFGIDLILRGHPSGGTDTTITYKNSNVVHLGIQSTDLYNSNGRQDFTIPYKIYDEDNYPTDKYDSYEEYTSSKEYTNAINYSNVISSFDDETVWMDICLVLPKIGADGTITIGNKTYIAKSSDTPYTTKLTLIISGGGLSSEESYVLDLTGLYSSEGVGDTSEILTVTPEAAATSIDILNAGTTPITVAKYSYGTKSYATSVSYVNKSSYIYLSSSDGNSFLLRRENSNGKYSTTSDSGNSVPFTATIISDNNKDDEVTFYGTTTSSNYTNNSFEIKPTKMTAQTDGGSWVRWYDDGTIQVTIDPENTQDLGKLLPGKYSATIYVNVVCAY